MNLQIKTNTLTSDEFLALYSSVGWEPPCKAQVEKALANTIATFTAYDDSTPVGMVRLIGDGGMSFYIKDFAVLPAYHGKGIGQKLLTTLETYIKSSLPPDWAVSLELISTLSAQPFYEKMGFEPRPCAWDGPGMFKMIR